MQKVLTAEQMREVDRLTTERYGIPSILLMENAAHAVARVITEKLGGSVKGKSILVLCGKGNNGGDGAALARILWTQGADVDVYLFGEVEETKGTAKENFIALAGLAIQESFRNFLMFSEIINPMDFFERELYSNRYEKAEVVVDSLFGTGLSRAIDGNLGDFIECLVACNGQRPNVLFVSIDIPSGLNSDIGHTIGHNFDANITVSFTSPKPANILPPASNFSGKLIVDNIGTPQELIDEQNSHLFLTESVDAQDWLTKTDFSIDSYKNKRGHALVIAGSESYSGAAVLCGNAAIRSGVGLVTIVTPKSSKESVASRVLPEVIVRGVSETESGAIAEAAFTEIAALLEMADAVAIGGGISQDESTKKFVQQVIENRRQPTIVDADALNLLSPFASNGESQYPLILTPHEGEFMRLLGTDDKDAIKDRVAAVRDFAQKHKVILVLKGERVLIGEPGGKVVVNPTGNSGLGKAGNGDTLTGILTSFAAQAAKMKIDIFETVVAAVYVAGMAGDIAEQKYGKRVMTASDVRECLTEAFEKLAVN